MEDKKSTLFYRIANIAPIPIPCPSHHYTTVSATLAYKAPTTRTPPCEISSTTVYSHSPAPLHKQYDAVRPYTPTPATLYHR